MPRVDAEKLMLCIISIMINRQLPFPTPIGKKCRRINLSVGASGFVLLIPFLFLTAPLWAANSLADDEAAIERHITALRDPREAVRAAAARSLRRMVAKYPGDTVNIASPDHGEAFWQEKIKRVHLGMKADELHALLPYFKQSRGDSGGFGGGIVSHLQRLDYHWTASYSYGQSGVVKLPKLIAGEMLVEVQLPPKYSGRWTSWYVNGRKGIVAHYRNGEYDGLLTHYYDNGRKMAESRANGLSQGWYRDGRLKYRRWSRDGKREGIEKEWHLNGRLESRRNYRNNKAEGVHVRWFDNGQMHSRVDYQNGHLSGVYRVWYPNGQMEYEAEGYMDISHGIESRWNERGVLEYRRLYANGKLVRHLAP